MMYTAPTQFGTEITMGQMPDITVLLRAWADGNPDALEEAVPLIYQELRRIARRQLRSRSPQTLQTTALAHEAYLRLVHADGVRWQDRAHFFAVAAPDDAPDSCGCGSRPRCGPGVGGGGPGGIHA